MTDMTDTTTTEAAIGSPPINFADAYEELQAISRKLKPIPGQIPDVDAIEPMIRRTNMLAKYCQGRIEAVRKLIGEQGGQ